MFPESGGEDSSQTDQNFEHDIDYPEDANPSLPTNNEMRNYINKMRAYYLGKIEELNKHLRHLDEMENSFLN